MRPLLAACLPLFFLLAVHTLSASAQTPPYLRTWTGQDDHTLSFPTGVSLDAAGSVYVADCDNNRIEVFTSDGVFLASWGSLGSDQGQFNKPTSVAIGPDGNVYVADYGNSRVQVFTPAGDFLRQWGGYGISDGQMKYPNAVSVATSGDVYVAEGGRIQKFTANGVFLRKWTGNGHDSFGTTMGVAVDGAGNFFVSRYPGIDGAVWAFSAAGAFMTGWGTSGSGDGQFSNYPGQLGIDASGLIYVADRNNNRIQVFTADGTFLQKWGEFGSALGQLYYPSALGFDSAGDIFVADTMNNRIQAFGPIQQAVPARNSTWGAIKARYH